MRSAATRTLWVALALATWLAAGRAPAQEEEDAEPVDDVNSEPGAGPIPRSQAVLFTWKGDDGDAPRHLWRTFDDHHYADVTYPLDAAEGRILEPRGFTPSRVSGGQVFFVGRLGRRPYLWTFEHPGAPKRVRERGAPVIVRSGLLAVGRHLLFAATDPRHGTELWRLDIRSPSTHVYDIWTGGRPPRSSRPAHLTSARGLVFFAATKDGDRELFVVDPADTRDPRELDALPGGSSDPRGLAGAGDHGVFFVAYDGSDDRVLFSDGNRVRPVHGRYRAPADPTFVSGGRPSDDLLFFTADAVTGRELWVVDPDAARKKAKSLTTRVAPRALTAFDGKLYFTGAAAGKRVLWQSDGTPAHTRVAWTLPGGPQDVDLLAAYAGTLFLTTRRTAEHKAELWRLGGPEPRLREFDGTLLRPFSAGEGMLFFEDLDGRRHLWVTRGTSRSTYRVMRSRGSHAAGYTALGDRLVFAADGYRDRRAVGREPWITGGDRASTRMLKNIARGVESSNPDGFTRAGALVYFVAREVKLGGSGPESKGRELWVTDGTENGTELVEEIRPGEESAGIRELTALGSRVLFAANDGSGEHLWWAEGAGNADRLRFGDDHLGEPRHLTVIRDVEEQYLFFTATCESAGGGRGVFVTDGTKVVSIRKCTARTDPDFTLMPHRHAVIFTVDRGVHGPEPHKVRLQRLRRHFRTATARAVSGPGRAPVARRCP